MNAALAEADGRSWVRRISWWPMLFGPVVIAALAAGRGLGADYGRLQVILEQAGPFLLAAGVGIYAVRLFVTRSPLFLILTFVAASLMCREIHFQYMDKAIFVLLPVAGLGAVVMRKKILARGVDWPQASWLLATAATYVLSQMVAKRVFSARHLPIIPDEATIHTALEEGAETVGHLLLLVASITGSWRRHRPRPGKVAVDEATGG